MIPQCTYHEVMETHFHTMEPEVMFVMGNSNAISGYTSEPSIHWIPDNYASLQVNVTILLLNVSCYLLHRLENNDTKIVTVLHTS